MTVGFFKKKQTVIHHVSSFTVNGRTSEVPLGEIPFTLRQYHILEAAERAFHK